MPKQSSERAVLAAAHAELVAAQRALAEAQEAYHVAMLACGEAGSDADDLTTQIDRLYARRTFGIVDLRIEQANQLEQAQAALKIAKQKAYPFELALDDAKVRIAETEHLVGSTQDRVTRAATAVVAAEAPPVARAHMMRLEKALDVILEHGPDAIAMVHKSLLPAGLAQEIEGAGGGLLWRALEWPAFEQRYRTSPWRAAVDMLKQDPQTTLPSVTS